MLFHKQMSNKWIYHCGLGIKKNPRNINIVNLRVHGEIDFESALLSQTKINERPLTGHVTV